MLRRIALAAGLLALASPGSALASRHNLRATVGPGFTITLTDAAGAPVTALAAGTYEIAVSDQASIHNFHLMGPGVNQSTGVAFVGTATWTVTLGAGTYTFQCGPHQQDMRGTFTVTGGTSPPPPPPPPSPPPVAAPTRLVATVGPGFTITLTRGGRRVTSLKAGRYTIVVRDRSAIHNFHLRGPGVNRTTRVAFRGTVTWRLRLRKGVHRFVCDPHRSGMRGSFRVR